MAQIRWKMSNGHHGLADLGGQFKVCILQMSMVHIFTELKELMEEKWLHQVMNGDWLIFRGSLIKIAQDQNHLLHIQSLWQEFVGVQMIAICIQLEVEIECSANGKCAEIDIDEGV